MKVGIMRCAQTENYCSGTTGSRMIRKKKGVFEGINEEIEVTGFINCGRCPGKKATFRARELVKRGADTIVFTSRIQKGTPIGYPRPFAKRMEGVVQMGLPDTVKYLNFTY